MLTKTELIGPRAAVDRVVNQKKEEVDMTMQRT